MGNVINNWNGTTKDRNKEKKGKVRKYSTFLFKELHEQNKNKKSEEQGAAPTGPPDRRI